MSSINIVSPPTTHQTVLVCGSLHFDAIVNAPHLPRTDETVVGSAVNYICGGKGGNQAVATAQNGALTAFQGCIGDDEFGQKLTAHLQQHNVDCSGLQKINGASGMSVAIVDSNGDYGAVIVSASNQSINCESIELVESIGMLMLQNEIPESVNVELARKASEHNIPVMLNAAPYRGLSVELQSRIDILILNRVEAAQFFESHLADTDDVITALQHVESSISTIIITLGKDGLVIRDHVGEVRHKSAFPVPVSSSHGAGDMFCGALASRIINGTMSNEALDYAMAAAAWYVSANTTERSELNVDAINLLLAENA